MGVPRAGKTSRITKRTTARRKPVTEAFKAKLVQFQTSEVLTGDLCVNKPQSPHNDALQEALKCTECADLHITPYMMEADISAGSYITSQYPPFFSCKSVQDDGISPLDTYSHHNDDITFWKDITRHQQKQYFDKVDALLRTAEVESGKPIDETTVLFAHYQVDFHIRQHYLAPRGFLNLCRTKDEIVKVNKWEWKVAVKDETNFAEDPDWGVGWKHEPSNSLGHRVAAWHKGERERREHLDEVKAQWADIQAERDEQRLRLRTVHFHFKGTRLRTCQFETLKPSPLTEKEIKKIAANAVSNPLS
ncbi:hypothetical protein N7457_001562 [Penicillium paradoxum]|uniref:uncharacterized protein n=1 Tax=Penicillium paradoxum TaxID=176176 RepID=UPI00254781DB|nr:uncharacterized protein N7457_001562 [Penicillium paradoxum]KAJ5794963.1 hypothetical protein N7457_001562 [Penicillium paradoxum]